MARAGKSLTADSVTEEVRFLLKTLMRDDLFGPEVSLTEAEKLLESSLAIGFVEYCAFLKRHAYVDIDRARNTIAVLPRGRNVAEGGADPSLTPTLAAHFSRHLDGPRMNVLVAREDSLRLPSRSSPTALASPSAPLPPSSLGSSSSSSSSSPAAPTPAVPGPLAAVPALSGPMTSISLDAIAVDRWERSHALGQGSLGAVYRATDRVLERDVVVKEVRHVYELVTYVPRDEITRRVRDAVMAQARLDHPHILRVVDVSFVDDVPTIVLDYAAGGSLRERMARGPLPVPVVMRLALQLAYGLHHAHRSGVIHGGLKPENILFDVAGNARIADFGLARAAERLPDVSTTAPPVYVGRGNPSYMAPEQLHRGELNRTSDIYALGILLYELLTGALPGRRSPMPSTTPRVKEALGDKGARAVDDLFDKMTRDPIEERFASFDEVLTALYAALPEQDALGRGTLLLYEEDPLALGPLSAEGEAVQEIRSTESAAS